MNNNLIKKATLGLLFASSMSALTINFSECETHAVDLKNNQINVSKKYVEKMESYFIGDNTSDKGRYLVGKENQDSGFKYIKGKIPVLISAPHSMRQPARGNYNDGYGYKSADTYTGAIAKILAEKTDAHVIYKTATKGTKQKKAIDENYTEELTAYRKKIKEVVEEHGIVAVIDIHGYNDSERNDSIIIGTGYGKNLLGRDDVLNAVIEALNVNGFKMDTPEENIKKENKVVLDTAFTSSGGKTISSYMSQNFNVPCIQIEFGKSFRNQNKMTNFNRTINSMIDIIDNVSTLSSENENWKKQIPTSNYTIAQVVDVKAVANVREKGNTDSKIVAKAKKGEYVTVVGDTTKSWVKVKYRNKEGYIYGKYLKYLKGTVKGDSNVTSHIYLRSSDDADSKKIEKVKIGKHVDILGLGNNKDWYKVRYKNSDGKYVVGYASSKYIKRG